MTSNQTQVGAAPRAEITAIDCHAHVMEVDRPLSPERHSAPKRNVYVEDYISVLDAHGIAHGLLTAPSFYGSDNTLLLEALAKQPERLRGTAIVEPTTTAAALEGMRQKGVCGIRLNWIKRKSLPGASSSEYQRLFSLVSDLGMHVEVFLEGELLESVLPHIRRNKLNVVLDHFGCPDPTTGLEGSAFREVLEAIGSGDTWVKLSAPYRLRGADPQRYVDALRRAGGPERLLWATDWPWVGYEEVLTYQQCIDWIVAWIPDERARRTVLAETPQKLFGFALPADNQ